MIYTFEISLNSSDYVTFTPSVIPQITSERVGWRVRDKVDSFKINESLNSSVYATLESFFDDSDTFNYTNKIRVKKSGTIKWTFTFGIKMGKINYENKFYEVQPETDDVYTDLLYYKNRNITRGLATEYHYNDEDELEAHTIGEIHGAECVFFEDYIKTGAASLVGQINLLSSHTYTSQSAFLWNDNYPDGSSPGGTLNYVSSDYNYLRFLSISRDNDNITLVNSIDDVLEFPKAFQCDWFVASDYTLHFEHVSWFEDQIADYQLDLTGEDYYDDSRVLGYSTPEILNTENFAFPTDNEEDDYDDVQILYDPNLVNFRHEKIDHRTEYDTFIASDFADLGKFMVVGIAELAVGYKASTFPTLTTSGPDVTTGIADASGQVAQTNYMATDGGETLDYVIDVTYTPSLTNNLQIRGYLAGVGQGSWVNLNAGLNSASVTGDEIRIQSTGAQNFNYTLEVTADNTYRIPWEAGEISTTNRQNNYLSWANILDRFWTYSRYAESGTLNESPVDFDSVKFNKEQDKFKFYYASDIDPMRGIQTDYGIGMIQSMTRFLESDFIEVKLRYNE